jgi:hypothetical protein
MAEHVRMDLAQIGALADAPDQVVDPLAGKLRTALGDEKPGQPRAPYMHLVAELTLGGSKGAYCIFSAAWTQNPKSLKIVALQQYLCYAAPQQDR